MRPRTKYALGLAAVLVVLAIGYVLVWGASGSGSGTTTNQLSTTPTP
jgi:ABC-type transporter Mla subunit MlaD